MDHLQQRRALTAPAAPASPGELFLAFTRLALQGFGGVLAVAQRVLCEEKRWLTPKQFVELLAFAQALPGPNVCNLALFLGDRFFGWRGAAAALAGLIAAPLAIVLGATVAYVNFEQVPWVAGAIRGMGAVAAGLVIATALKLLPSLRSNPMGWPASAALGAAVLIAVLHLHWHLPLILLGVGTIACALAWCRVGATATPPDKAAQ